jgi:hypothetical protein
MTRRPLPLLLLACSACASDPHTWRLEGIVSADETLAVQASFDEWCERSNRAHCDRITGDGDSVIRLLPHWKPSTLGDVGADRDQDGDYLSVTVRIALDRDAADWFAQLQWTVLHELGHWYRGFWGHLGPGTVMSPCRSNAAVHLTEADLTDELWDVQGCGE